MEEKLSFDEVVDSVLRGMHRSKSDFNILSNGIYYMHETRSCRAENEGNRIIKRKEELRKLSKKN